jgi:hypothetical protein
VSSSTLRRAALVVVPLALALSACGGSSGGGADDAASGSGSVASSSRPSVSDLTKALEAESTKMTPSAAKCLAQTMESSSLSDTALEAVVKNDRNYQPDAADSAALKTVTSKLIQCVGSLVSSGAASALPSTTTVP